MNAELPRELHARREHINAETAAFFEMYQRNTAISARMLVQIEALRRGVDERQRKAAPLALLVQHSELRANFERGKEQLQRLRRDAAQLTSDSGGMVPDCDADFAKLIDHCTDMLGELEKSRVELEIFARADSGPRTLGNS